MKKKLLLAGLMFFSVAGLKAQSTIRRPFDAVGNDGISLDTYFADVWEVNGTPMDLLAVETGTDATQTDGPVGGQLAIYSVSDSARGLILDWNGSGGISLFAGTVRGQFSSGTRHRSPMQSFGRIQRFNFSDGTPPPNLEKSFWQNRMSEPTRSAIPFTPLLRP
ncbi:MAG TPA: hypothetical protein VMH30_02220 [Verrucomicrobiae bacterium]|nr:hypothetical protein [Verrucomicrobiae bacterium]